jgi:BlaI family transcriptional regulator, penicillinase repressor
MHDKLGDRELDLMQALWERGAATVADVHQALLGADQQVAYTTVQTMLNRLEEKGLVTRRKRGRAFVYRPLIKEPAAAGEALRRLIDRFFAGDPAELATHLVGGKMAARDLDRIQALIDARRREETGKP